MLYDHIPCSLSKCIFFIFMIKMATLERLLNGLEGEELIFKSAYKNILVQYHYYRFVVVFLPF